MITWNSLKTWNSLSGEYILGSEISSFAQYIRFHDAWNHAWKTEWKVCVSAYEAHQVLRICIDVLEMRIQIRMAKTTKCKMLPMVYLCYLKRQAKSF